MGQQELALVDTRMTREEARRIVALASEAFESIEEALRDVNEAAFVLKGDPRDTFWHGVERETDWTLDDLRLLRARLKDLKTAVAL